MASPAEWRIDDIERLARGAAKEHELSALRSTVDRLEHTVGEIRASLDGLRATVEGLQASVEAMSQRENA